MNLLSVLEAYYDAAPRPSATTKEVGPFTLFVKTDPEGWDFYARPRLALDVPVTVADVDAVQARQRELGVPESIEWVHQTTPSLLDAVRTSGLHIDECPLLVLPDDHAAVSHDHPHRVELLDASSPDLPAVVGAVDAAFGGKDDVEPGRPGPAANLMRADLMAMAGAYDGSGVVGGGAHSPRGTTTELVGIAVLPRARRRGIGAAVTPALVTDARRRGSETVFLSAQDDTVARIYESVGFVRVGTACVAKPSEA